MSQLSEGQVSSAGDRAPASFVDSIDLRDSSPATIETCNALALTLRDGDIEAADRLFGFLGQLQPDRRLLLGDLIQPMLRDELRELEGDPGQADLFVATARALFSQYRGRMFDASRDGVLLCGRRDDPDVLILYLVALLMEEVGIAAQIQETADAVGIERLLREGHRRALCMTVSLAWEYADLVQCMSRRRLAVIVVGESVRHDPTLNHALGASAFDWRVNDIAGTLMYLRGPLTRAEAQVLKLVADGHTNQHMAHELGISVSAVKARLEGAFAKLSAADRAHAASIALRRHWIR